MTLSLIILMPLLGIVALLLTPSNNRKLLHQIGISFSLLTFIISISLFLKFDDSCTHFQFVEYIPWLPFLNVHFTLGIDGISLFLVLLTTFLIPMCLLSSWKSIQKNVKEYIICFLLMESLMVCIFTVLDLILFYVFFESVLIPMFIVIGVWGSRSRKIHAAYQFFLYTLFGSVLMLLAVIYIYFEAGTTEYEVLLTTSFSEDVQLLLWLAFFASFAVKVPMVPVHIWLPEAHVEAPTAGSVLLAGVLLKLGTYGLLRFSIPLFPYATTYFTPLVYTMSIVGIIYASLTTIRQIDLKKIIAYSSVAHMSYVTLGLFSLTVQGIEGSVFLMLSHGVVSSALFLLVGVLYDRYKTRLVKYYGGLVSTMPLFTILFLFFTFANISLPGTSSFIGEFLIFLGIFYISSSMTLLAGIGTIFGAAYAIWLFNRVAFGNPKVTWIHVYRDMTKREIIIFIPFVALTLLMGLLPNIFLNPMHIAVAQILV